MPVLLHLANLIVNKKAIIDKYNGGIEQFRIDFKNENELFQEDVELFSLSRMNCDEFPEDRLLKYGLDYSSSTQHSEDYTIVVRYGGCLWDVDWLEAGTLYAYHTHCSMNHRVMALQMEQLTMDKIVDIIEANGMLPTIK